MKKIAFLGFAFLLCGLLSASAQTQKIYWGDSVPKGWNGSWPAKFLTVPRGYLIPAELDYVVEKLRTHNIRVDMLTKPVKATGEEFVIDKVGQARGGGTNMIKLEGGFAKSPLKEFPAGTFRVDLAQPMANMAFYCLEPQAADGFVGWGVLEPYFKSIGADKRSVVYPIFKYFKIME